MNGPRTSTIPNPGSDEARGVPSHGPYEDGAFLLCWKDDTPLGDARPKLDIVLEGDEMRKLADALEMARTP